MHTLSGFCTKPGKAANSTARWTGVLRSSLQLLNDKARPIGRPARRFLSPSRPSPTELIGRLSIPRLHLSVMVREGIGPDTLQLAVGHIPGTALPGQDGRKTTGCSRCRITVPASIPNSTLVFSAYSGACMGKNIREADSVSPSAGRRSSGMADGCGWSRRPARDRRFSSRCLRPNRAIPHPFLSELPAKRS